MNVFFLKKLSISSSELITFSKYSSDSLGVLNTKVSKELNLYSVFPCMFFINIYDINRHLSHFGSIVDIAEISDKPMPEIP